MAGGAALDDAVGAGLLADGDALAEEDAEDGAVGAGLAAGGARREARRAAAEHGARRGRTAPEHGWRWAEHAAPVAEGRGRAEHAAAFGRRE